MTQKPDEYKKINERLGFAIAAEFSKEIIYPINADKFVQRLVGILNTKDSEIEALRKKLEESENFTFGPRYHEECCRQITKLESRIKELTDLEGALRGKIQKYQVERGDLESENQRFKNLVKELIAAHRGFKVSPKESNLSASIRINDAIKKLEEALRGWGENQQQKGE